MIDFEQMKQCGIKERTKLTNLLHYLNITNFTTTPENKSICYDGIINHTTNKPIFIEVKVRRHPSTKFPDHLLQQDKFNNILKKTDRFLYINFFSDNTAIIFNISKRTNIKWFIKRLPAYTTINKESKRIWIDKSVTMLTFDPSIDLMIKGSF